MAGKNPFQKAIISGLVLALIMIGPLPAREVKKATQPWKVDDVVNQERASDFKISPEGTRVVWVKNVPDRDKDGRLSHLFLNYPHLEQPAIQLTGGQLFRILP